MSIEQTISQHPALATICIISLVAILVWVINQAMGLIKALYTQRFSTVEKVLEGHSKATDNLSQAVKDLRDELQRGRQEAKEDRDNFTKIVGNLFKRVSVVEAEQKRQAVVCQMTRQYCPHNHPIEEENERETAEST